MESCTEIPAPVTRLEYNLENVRTPEELRAVRIRAVTALRLTVQSHLDAGLTIRECLGSHSADWTREGSRGYRLPTADAVSEHLLARFQGFGTTLQFLPFATTFGEWMAIAPGCLIHRAA
jgi:hypothetical protein